MQRNPDVVKYYEAAAQEYTNQYRPQHKEYPANLKRLDLILSRIKELKPETLLDCGCGEGTPMCRIYDAGVQVWGFDLAPGMVEQAKATAELKGLKNRVWQGDIMESSSFSLAGLDIPDSFDICLAMGVLPHIQDEVGAIKNMAAATRPGGRVLVEFRNELFALFTLNRYSHEFFRDKLIGIEDIKYRHPEFQSNLESFTREFENFFQLDVPPVRKGTSDVPGYDEILSKYHNPFEMTMLFSEAGLQLTDIHFYHYHALPPMFENAYPELFRKLSLEMESNASDWRGYFMSSAYVVEAVKGK